MKKKKEFLKKKPNFWRNNRIFEKNRYWQNLIKIESRIFKKHDHGANFYLFGYYAIKKKLNKCGNNFSKIMMNISIIELN